MHLRHGEQVNLNLLASSEYPSHVVELIVLHRPASSTFDNNTGLFKWTAINGEYYVSVRAQLKGSDFISKHDIDFYVKASDATNTTSTSCRSTTTMTRYSSSNYLVQQAMIIISIFGLTLLLGQ
ncbi:unnamed protein product [Rotaria sp. Silwood1]|nr:unnamed protein product [Rotaria sp. Silwood1]CAF1510065.1 unnamed protein product [Rotaria sp. Silwood1]CAF3660514.1 unnamed protein product [Rotaria sp. Silwood1]CAF3689709.1 unnamed protein product [Rotaria sp. Silwood1]CAF4635329.1 unnamed protein product [Rotaria sp. Silwood1]